MWQHQGDFQASHEHIWQTMPASQPHFSKLSELWLILITCSGLTDINRIPACANMLVWMRASAGNQLPAPWGSTSRWQSLERGRAIPSDSEPKRKTHPCWHRKPNATILQCKYQPCPSSWPWQNKTLSHPERLCIPWGALSIHPAGSESPSPGTVREINSISKQREVHYQKVQPARSFGNENMQL